MPDLLPYAAIPRVQPFAGLVIDPPTWGAAHDYHRLHQQLHLLSLHGSGIAQGLRVLPTDPPGDEVVVEPGIAIDAEGRAIVVPERQRVRVDTRDGTAYLVLAFAEAAPSGEGAREQRGQVIEGFRLVAESEAPADPALELARVDVGGGAKLELVAARNPWAPAQNEIDLRHRVELRGALPRTLSVGVVSCGPPAEGADDHLLGIANLVEACAVAGVRALPAAANGASVPEADLLYVTGPAGSAPDGGIVEALGERASAGAWILADACGPGDAFASGLAPLLDGADGDDGWATEAAVEGAHYVFGEAPPGALDGDVRWGRRALISGRDFGCAWSGRRQGEPLPRSQIRDALEFGVNIALCAGGYGRTR